MEFLIITGLSGAGKSMVVKFAEDMGYYCVDNMPVELIPAFAELYMAAQSQSKPTHERVALVTDVRAGQSFDALFESLHLIRAMNCEYKILFLESKPDTIMRRYKESRRRHPLAMDNESLEQTLAREYELLLPLRERADYVVDTSSLSTTQLRSHIAALFSEKGRRPMVVSLVSFGYKYGLPTESDLAFDVRFMPNPYHISELRSLSGLDEPVRDFVLKWPQTQDFLRRLKGMIDFLLPQYFEEGKTSLVISIGCTGGRHRSVAVSRVLFEHLQEKGYHAVLSHRDISRDPRG